MKHIGKQSNNKDIATIDKVPTIDTTVGSEKISDGTNTLNLVTLDTMQEIEGFKSFTKQTYFRQNYGDDDYIYIQPRKLYLSTYSVLTDGTYSLYVSDIAAKSTVGVSSSGTSTTDLPEYITINGVEYKTPASGGNVTYAEVSTPSSTPSAFADYYNKSAVDSLLAMRERFTNFHITGTDDNYVEFSSGLLIQWGIYDYGSFSVDYSFSKSYPIAFARNPCLMLTPRQALGTTGNTVNIMASPLVTSPSTFTARITSKYGVSGGSCRYVFWFAIGSSL